MRIVDQPFQLFRGAKARRGREETAHMIAKGAVIRVLLDGHDLDGVIPVAGHARQHFETKFLVGSGLLFLRGHANMALVDEQRRGVRPKIVDAELVFLRRIPNLGRKDLRRLVLHHTPTPSRNAFASASLPLHAELIQVAVVKRVRRQHDFPVARRTFQAPQTVILAFFPTVKVAHEVYRGGIRSPFPEHPPSVGHPLKAEIEVSRCKVREAKPSILRQVLFLLNHIIMSPFDGFGVGFQPRVFLNQHQFVHHLMLHS